MEIWVLITLTAAFLQNLRSLLQRHLKGVLSNTGATFVRFGFGLPVGIALLAILAFGVGNPMPTPNTAFFGWIVVAAGSQIAAQVLLLYTFGFRNFVVGTAYSRTEPAQAALFGLLLLGETAGAGTIAAIAVSLVGVMLLSVARTSFSFVALFTSLGSRIALYGLASGAMFGVAAVAYRAASLSLDGPAGFMERAATTLVAALILQTISMLAWMAWREREQFAAIASAWRPAAATGLVGALASFGWFMAMTLQQAAVVKAVAQVEMLFALATSVVVFREHVNYRELAGSALIVAGILALLYVG